MYFVWKRPEDVEFPKIWLDFKAGDPVTNEIVNYRIQDLPENLFGEAIKFMTEYYMTGDVISVSKKLHLDEVSKQELIDVWIVVLSQKLTVVCFKEGSDEIIGLNFLYARTTADHNQERDVAEGFALNDINKFYAFIKNYENLLEKHGVDTILNSMGMAVHPQYRYHGIATELLRARIPLCRAVDIKLTATLFPSIGAQIPAYKAGYKKEFELTFDEIEKLGYSFPGLSGKLVKVMSRLID
jgi:GNAT superfamily N-acetyltransferase